MEITKVEKVRLEFKVVDNEITYQGSLIFGKEEYQNLSDLEITKAITDKYQTYKDNLTSRDRNG